MKDIIVKKSKISGKGVFANRDFKKGEVVLKWSPKQITKIEAENLSESEKHYVLHSAKKYYLMQKPERYVNHSCDSNTFTKNFCDVAKRNIKKREEITSNYNKEDRGKFKCKCSYCKNNEKL